VKIDKVKGLVEVGKGIINFSNMLLVLFVLNTYLQKDDVNYFLVFGLLYASINLYYVGYRLTSLVNDNDKESKNADRNK